MHMSNTCLLDRACFKAGQSTLMVAPLADIFCWRCLKVQVITNTNMDMQQTRTMEQKEEKNK